MQGEVIGQGCAASCVLCTLLMKGPPGCLYPNLCSCARCQLALHICARHGYAGIVCQHAMVCWYAMHA